MAVAIRVRVSGYKTGDLKKLGIHFQRPAEVLEKVANHRRAVFAKKMRSRLNWNYTATKRLTPKYRRWKDKRYPGRTIREATGEFRAGHKVTVYYRSVKEELTDWKSEFIQSTRPILPPEGRSLPQVEQQEINRILTQFFKKVGFK